MISDFLYSPHCWGAPSHPKSTHPRTEPAKNHDYTSIHRDSPLAYKLSHSQSQPKFSTFTPRILTPVDSRSSYPAEPAHGKFHPGRPHAQVPALESCKPFTLHFCSRTTSVLRVQESTEARRDFYFPTRPDADTPSPAPPSGRQFTGVRNS